MTDLPATPTAIDAELVELYIAYARLLTKLGVYQTMTVDVRNQYVDTIPENRGDVYAPPTQFLSHRTVDVKADDEWVEFTSTGYDCTHYYVQSSVGCKILEVGK